MAMPSAAVSMNSKEDRTRITSNLDGHNLVDHHIGEDLKRHGCRQHLQANRCVKEEVAVFFVDHKHRATHDDGYRRERLGCHSAVSRNRLHFTLQLIALANDLRESV